MINMKKILLVCLVLFTYTLQGQVPEVQEVQKSIFTKVTATWCPNCGTWGWSFFKGLEDENNPNAILLKAHYSGDLQTSVAQALSSNFNATGQPNFFLNNDRISVSSGNIAAKLEELKNSIDENATQAPIANTALFAAIGANNDLQISTNSRFFQDAEGEYHLGVYVTEDAIVNNQSGQGSNAVHSRILQTAVTEDAFGVLLTSGNTTSGTEFSNNFTIALDPNWEKDNLRLVGIIWEKVGDDFQFVNAEEILGTGINLVSNENILLEKTDFNIQPNISDEAVLVNITVKENIEQAQINLYDLQGRLVHTLWNDDLTLGTQQFAINKNNLGLNAGMYLVQMQSVLGTITKKVIFQ